MLRFCKVLFLAFLLQISHDTCSVHEIIWNYYECLTQTRLLNQGSMHSPACSKPPTWKSVTFQHHQTDPLSHHTGFSPSLCLHWIVPSPIESCGIKIYVCRTVNIVYDTLPSPADFCPLSPYQIFFTLFLVLNPSPNLLCDVLTCITRPIVYHDLDFILQSKYILTNEYFSNLWKGFSCKGVFHRSYKV